MSQQITVFGAPKVGARPPYSPASRSLRGAAAHSRRAHGV